ncbi:MULTISPECIES: B12-binding domain-containing protein [unclassified Novosphingobium]|uniref:cobalamin B12-binding domain-containing protein n=1 Tax=unclassified Novosphingobium TaxID=2644732 RepID=UPI0025F52FFB|nr:MULTISPECIES: cobalamin B12-binding domain-containing protein [unclassified Novosphingobium]
MATVYGAGSTNRTQRGGRATRGHIMRANAPAREAVWDGARDGGRDGGRDAGWDSGRLSPTSVNSLIQEQIIPRLLQAHTYHMPRVIAHGILSVEPAEAAKFVSLPLTLEADELLDLVEAYIANGVSVESIFVDLLAASARRLGQHWEEDECDFLDVTMGLWRLQEVMRQVALRHPPEAPLDPRGRSALLSPLPGDEHSLGTLMVEEVFARAGWQTEVLINPKRRELLQIIAERQFDLVGLTIACDCTTSLVADLISAIRSISRAPKVQILIGGHMVNANPGMVAEVGADGTAVDANSFLALADKLVKRSARLCLPIA